MCDLQRTKKELERSRDQCRELSEDFKTLETLHIKIVKEHSNNADLINTKQHKIDSLNEELIVTKAQVCFLNTCCRMSFSYIMHFCGAG